MGAQGLHLHTLNCEKKDIPFLVAQAKVSGLSLFNLIGLDSVMCLLWNQSVTTAVNTWCSNWTYLSHVITHSAGGVISSIEGAVGRVRHLYFRQRKVRVSLSGELRMDVG